MKNLARTPVILGNSSKLIYGTEIYSEIVF